MRSPGTRTTGLQDFETNALTLPKQWKPAMDLNMLRPWNTFVLPPLRWHSFDGPENDGNNSPGNGDNNSVPVNFV